MLAATPGQHPTDPDGYDEERFARRGAAFGAVVAANCDRLCRYVYRYVGSREAAEDIVQEVFLRLWERGDDLHVHDPVPYLFQAAHNRALSHLRHQEVRERWRARSAQQEPAPTTEGGQVELERDDLARAIERAVAELPGRCRQVFTMSRDQGLPHAEIARILGVSVKTVESHVWRAITAVRAKVAPYL